MSRRDDGARVAAAFGDLLLRSSRAHLYRVLIADTEGVDGTTYPVLSGLARLGPATTSELAARIGLERTVTTRYATRLEQAGLLARQPHPTDARATTLVLTELGERTVGAMRERLRDVFVDAMADWTAEESATFTRLFDRLVTGLADPQTAPSSRPSSP
ncbi:MarR family winged helix-turn-helix transcriptional regulator [Umezawaea tangerina]|nr:MarR family transcriptional regulator [Umezawaea tangerina]